MDFVNGTDRLQINLPDTLDEYIEENNICRIIDAFVESLDLAKLGFKHATLSNTGRPPYHPAVLLKLYIYGMLNRVRSSRRLHTETLRNIEVMWLINKLIPGDRTICEFRKDNAKAIVNVFKEFNKFCLSQGLFGCESVAIDGSKFRANNSRRNIYTRENVNKDLREIEKKLNAKVTEYLAELETNDISEDIGDTEVSLNKSKIEDAIRTLNDSKHELEAVLSEMDKSGEDQFATNDTDSRLMIPGGDGRDFDARYNAQFAVDIKNSLIVDCEVTNACNDKGQLKNMADRAKEIMEVDKINALVDKGYYDGDDIVACESDNTVCFVAKPAASGSAPEQLRLDKFTYYKDLDAYLCPTKQILVRTHFEKDGNNRIPAYTSTECLNCPVKKLCTKNPTGKIILRSPNQDVLDSVNKRTEENAELYKKRGQVVEHPFGTIKSVWGYRNFLCKGLVMVNAEMALTCLAYNFRRVFNIFKAKGTKMCLES